MTELRRLSVHLPDLDFLTDRHVSALLELRPADGMVMMRYPWPEDKGFVDRLKPVLQELGHRWLIVRFQDERIPLKNPRAWAQECAERVKFVEKLGVGLLCIGANEPNLQDPEGGHEFWGEHARWNREFALEWRNRSHHSILLPAPSRQLIDGHPDWNEWNTSMAYWQACKVGGATELYDGISVHAYGPDFERAQSECIQINLDFLHWKVMQYQGQEGETNFGKLFVTETNDCSMALATEFIGSTASIVNWFTLDWVYYGATGIDHGRTRSDDRAYSLVKFPEKYAEFLALPIVSSTTGPIEPPNTPDPIEPELPAPNPPTPEPQPDPPASEPPSMNEGEAFIRTEAPRRGIDPEKALIVADAEGGRDAPGRIGRFATGWSFWQYQLHYGGRGYEHYGTVAGMGNGFTEVTGWAPGDPAAWKDACRYALDAVKRGGWGPWYGAAARGIRGFDGVNRSHPWSGTPDHEWDYKTPTTPTTEGYVFPVVGYAGPVNLHWGTFPGASDIFAPRGMPVVAMRGGTVTLKNPDSGPDGAGGYYVQIRGDDGLDYYYAHGDRPPNVVRGQTVPTGHHLFGVGDTGNAAGTGPHLHLGIGHGILIGVGAQGGAGANFDAVALLRRVLAAGNPVPSEDDLYKERFEHLLTVLSVIGDNVADDLELYRSKLDDYGDPPPNPPTMPTERDVKAKWIEYGKKMDEWRGQMQAWRDRVRHSTHDRYQEIGAVGNALRRYRHDEVGPRPV